MRMGVDAEPVPGKDPFDLSGRTAIVTGGSRGLGLQIAEALGQRGARVALVSRRVTDLEAAADRLQAQGIEAAAFPCDVGQVETLPVMVGEVLDRWSAVDIVVNNAGKTWGAASVDHPMKAWDAVFAVNVDAAFVLSREVARRSMIERRWGRVVNVASVAGMRVGSSAGVATAAYSASKAALLHLTRSLAVEWAPHGITVNAIAPGVFLTGMTQGWDGLDGVAAQIPAGRVGGDTDLRGLAVLLGSDASSYLTGQVIAVDGGLSAC